MGRWRQSPRGLLARVVRHLGVASSTLRTWSRRYGLDPTRHDSGRHRRYQACDIARLMRCASWPPRGSLSGRTLGAHQAACRARLGSRADGKPRGTLPAPVVRGLVEHLLFWTISATLYQVPAAQAPGRRVVLLACAETSSTPWRWMRCGRALASRGDRGSNAGRRDSDTRAGPRGAAMQSWCGGALGANDSDRSPVPPHRTATTTALPPAGEDRR
jgi:hypothetical protein